MKTINIYTDGACAGNQSETNLGGWGAVLEYKQHTKEIFGGEKNTTNNRMEMTALIKALEAINKSDQAIAVFSDSSYLVECFRKKWYVKWKNNGWMTTKKTEVENRDLWENLFELVSRHNIEFYRVKGHVNLENPNINTHLLYKKFLEWNGPNFTFDDFKYITYKNNRADALANKGVDSLRDNGDM